MRLRHYSILAVVLTVPIVSPGADDGANTVEELKQLRLRTEALEKRVAEAKPAAPAAATVRAGSAYMNISFDSLADFGWSTESDVRQLQIGDHDPAQRGFTMPNTEFVFEGAIDPYLKGVGDVVLKLDEESETTIELEEAYLQTIALPGNLQARAGQWFTEFGRINPLHPHQWDFVDQPLVVGRVLGPEGLRNPGVRMSWLAPTPSYTELLLTVLNGNGGTAFSFRNPEYTFGRTPVERELDGPGDLLYAPRIVSSFDLSDAQTLVMGASGAVGPNDSGADTQTRIYGADAYWKWKSPKAHGGSPFISWQTEAMHRDYEAGADPETALTAETLTDWGIYSQVLWGFHKGWVVGLRGDYVAGDDGQADPDDVNRGMRERVSPDLTWYPTEFSKIRLQYNLDHGDRFGDEQSVWCQVEFLLGSHGAHKF